MKRNRKTEGFQTTLAERNAYGAYYIGQNMIYMLVTGYMITYLMMEGLEQTKIAAVVFAVKIWDAVNDALFGVVFDKVKFKSGRKCTPWLKLSTPLIAAATCLIFLVAGYPVRQRQAAVVRGGVLPVGFGVHLLRRPHLHHAEHRDG